MKEGEEETGGQSYHTCDTFIKTLSFPFSRQFYFWFHVFAPVPKKVLHLLPLTQSFGAQKQKFADWLFLKK